MASPIPLLLDPADEPAAVIADLDRAIAAGKAFAGMVGTTSKGPDYVVMFIALLQFGIFLLSLWVMFKLWLAVIEFLGEKSTARSELLATILGRAEASGAGSRLKLKAIGTGLGGTVTILALAVAAMYVVGNHIVTGR